MRATGTYIGVLVLLASCGSDHEEHCENSVLLYSTQCQAARRFVARDYPDLCPDPAAVELYFERWLRATEAEPMLAARVPQRYRTTDFDAELITTNARVISAWTAGDAPTGDAVFDTVIEALGPAVPNGPYARGHDNGDGTYSFPVRAAFTFSEDVLDARLQGTQTRLPAPVHRNVDDGTWVWDGLSPGAVGGDGDIARISFRFGWGDCLAGCQYFHSVLAIVPPDGEASVYDVGGDPLPPELQLSPSTKPGSPTM